MRASTGFFLAMLATVSTGFPADANKVKLITEGVKAVSKLTSKAPAPAAASELAIAKSAAVAAQPPPVTKEVGVKAKVPTASDTFKKEAARSAGKAVGPIAKTTATVGAGVAGCKALPGMELKPLKCPDPARR